MMSVVVHLSFGNHYSTHGKISDFSMSYWLDLYDCSFLWNSSKTMKKNKTTSQNMTVYISSPGPYSIHIYYNNVIYCLKYILFRVLFTSATFIEMWWLEMQWFFGFFCLFVCLGFTSPTSCFVFLLTCDLLPLYWMWGWYTKKQNILLLGS